MSSSLSSPTDLYPDVFADQPLPKSQVNSLCLDLLLGEMLPLAIRVCQQLDSEAAVQSTDSTVNKDTRNSEEEHAGGVEYLETDLFQSEDVVYRMELYGYNMGLRIGELLSQDGDKFVEPLEIMKFICRDVWKVLYGKQMDNLRTNHRGTYVLIDNNFKMISKFESQQGLSDTIRKIKPYLWFPSGVIRGILETLGIEAGVSAELTTYPAVSFSIRSSPV